MLAPRPVTTTQTTTMLGRTNMNEYRLTRPWQYRNPNCPGHKDKSARQGYYIRANTAKEAVDEMRLEFPHESFDVQLWKENVWQPGDAT